MRVLLVVVLAILLPSPSGALPPPQCKYGYIPNKAGVRTCSSGRTKLSHSNGQMKFHLPVDGEGKFLELHVVPRTVGADERKLMSTYTDLFDLCTSLKTCNFPLNDMGPMRTGAGGCKSGVMFADVYTSIIEPGETWFDTGYLLGRRLKGKIAICKDRQGTSVLYSDKDSELDRMITIDHYFFDAPE